MRTYLVQGVLVAEILILSEVYWIFLFSKSMQLFCAEILAPTSRVIPMGALKYIFLSLVYDLPIRIIIVFNKLACVITIISCRQPANSEVSLSHFFFFFDDIKS